MKPIILSLFMPLPLLEEFQTLMDGEIVRLDYRHFPDGETYIKIIGELNNRDVIIFDTLFHPDTKTLPLLLLAETARDLRANRIGLACPYLPYMRQDARFQPGEGITSAYFGKILSNTFDWLVTVDPHLHRRSSLDEIYTIPSQVVHASSTIGAWVGQNIEQPIYIGPDEESEQWVADIAKRANVPYVILKKTRLSDHDVSIQFPDFTPFLNYTPVLVDDIISTAKTMITTVNHLAALSMKPPVCIGVHGVFANGAYEALIATKVSKIVTCNTIPHPTNAIDILPSLVEGILKVI